MSDLGPWLGLVLLGAYHGVNPGMGWLFAVARGLQAKSRSAVIDALLPIAFGHEASIMLVAALVTGLEFVAAPQVLRVVGAVALISCGLYKLLQPRSHPRWVGFCVGWRDLTLWSFLMSSAHGAGLMLFPFLIKLPAVEEAESRGATLGHLDLSAIGQAAAAALLHTGTTLLVMGVVAVLVYEKVGVAVLRKAWVNLDLIWAVALIGGGTVALFT